MTVPASLLLKMARARTEGLTQARLAEAADISPAALNRYENGLREPSLAEVQRIVGHTDVRLVPALRREPRSRGIADLELPDASPYAPDERAVEMRLPAELLSRNGSLPGDDDNGPLLPEALLHLYAIQDLARDARQVAGRLQLAWREEHEKQSAIEERYRDLIHQLQPVGYGACQADAVLARAIDDRHDTEERPGRRRARSAPEPARLGTLAWAHVVCCLRAEAALCAERAALLRGALTAAERQSAARARLEAAQERARTAPDRLEEGELEAAREELDQAHQRCRDLCWGGVGGVRRIGQAGERYLAIELDQLAQRARALFDELATTPAFTAWRARHASADPLYDLWLDGGLSLWHAPPALYPDTEAFYAAWEHRDLAAARKELLERHPRASLASVEGTFPDQTGGQWALSIQVPSATVCNDDWTEPTAVVTALQMAGRGGQGGGAVYMLARGVDARQAGALMDQMRGAKTLDQIGEVAARLRTLPTHP
ncbi:helix-turn-helix domain-containing protein [Streptomyces sp. A5-4]|uniref:helix-turn-helix domain-containing protein n=1 Tax=Streptomyces sp. A5-4 TaxID=3384771 RepID=UPI003DA91A53